MMMGNPLKDLSGKRPEDKLTGEEVTVGGGRKARQQKKEKRMDDPITEQRKDSNTHFSEHDIKMTSKHLKRCSILVIREM